MRRLSRHELRDMSRRELLKLGLVASGGVLLPIRHLRADGDDNSDDDSADGDSQSPPVEPFQREMPVPEVLDPVSRFSVGPADPQCALGVPGFTLPPPILYEIPMRIGQQEIIPGQMTEIWGYTGNAGVPLYPGPTIKVDRNQPIVVRFINELDIETSIHNHGGFQSSEADGFPNDFIFPGEFKDFCYPNIAADDDDAEFATFQWYHDHAMDVTGENVYMGLAAFYLLTDDLEQSLILDGVLPAEEFDIPIVLQDRLFGADAHLIYDPMDHDGVIGDRFLANGVIQPKFHVQRRKYRFRFLNGANARVYALQLSSGQPILQIGNDSWLLPFAVNRPHLLLAPAERADVVIDFSQYSPGDEVFLTNHLTHDLDDGRGPQEDIDEPEDWPQTGTPLIKFIVGDAASAPYGMGRRRLTSRYANRAASSAGDATVAPGTPLRPHTPIHPDEIVRTRTFEFERSHGAWVVNDEFFDPDRDDADPQVGTAERWILENDSGGWVHPIHIHMEAQQIQRIEGRSPPPHMAAKKDTVLLGDFNATVFIKFRTFVNNRYVFHCHNLEHEDMRMMGVFRVT